MRIEARTRVIKSRDPAGLNTEALSLFSPLFSSAVLVHPHAQLTSRFRRRRPPLKSVKMVSTYLPPQTPNRTPAAGNTTAPDRESYILRQHCVAFGKLSIALYGRWLAHDTTECPAASTTTSAIGIQDATRHHITETLTNMLLFSSP